MINTRDKFRRRVEILTRTHDCLCQRQTMHWGDGERSNAIQLLDELGIVLVSKTGAGKRGHVVKFRQVPVAVAYFGAPLQRHADLYILGIQTRPAK